MNMVKTALIALTFSTTPAYALEWTETVTRGLTVYRIQLESGAIWLTCDPERVFGGNSNASLSIEPINTGNTNNITITSDQDTVERLTLNDDKIWEYTTDPAQWDRLVAIIASGGAYQITAGDMLFDLKDMPELSNLEC